MNRFFVVICLVFVCLWKGNAPHAQAPVINTDTKTIAQVGMNLGNAVALNASSLVLFKNVRNLENSYEDYYTKLYTKNNVKQIIKKRIDENDEKLMTALRYTTLTLFLLALKNAAIVSDDVFGFVSELKMTKLFHNIVPQMLARILYFKASRNISQLSLLDMNYLVAAQHEVVRSARLSNAVIDKTMYLMVFIGIVKSLCKPGSSQLGEISKISDKLIELEIWPTEELLNNELNLPEDAE